MLSFLVQKDPGKKREGKNVFGAFDLTAYAKKNFGMYAGEEQAVKLRFKNELAGVVIDRFGKDLIIVPAGEDHFHVSVNVAVSSQFFGWIFALGDGVEILGPENVVESMKEELKRNLEKYR